MVCRGDGPQDGIIFRAVSHLFKSLARKKDDMRVTLKASYCEIYNERVYDLVNLKKKSLQIKWEAGQGFHVPDLKVSGPLCGEHLYWLCVWRGGNR